MMTPEEREQQRQRIRAWGDHLIRAMASIPHYRAILLRDPWCGSKLLMLEEEASTR